MIKYLVHHVLVALEHVKRHPQIQFAFVLIIVLPLLFLYSSNQFLEAGRANQDKLQRDRIGLLHDSFVSLLSATQYTPAIAQHEIEKIAAQNPDITKFRVVSQTGVVFTPVAALRVEAVSVPEAEVSVYQAAGSRFDESLIFPFFQGEARYWQAVRAIQDDTGQNYYILTETSFEQVDAYLAGQEQNAYFSLIIVYLVLLGIAYWLIRLTNYRALYAEAEQAIKTKDLFTNMIAHELRAPLTAIVGYASMGQEAGSPDKYGQIKLSGERLLGIVNDLLDIARIQSGQLNLTIEELPVEPVAAAVVAELSPSAQSKGIALSLPESTEMHLAYVDKKRLQQVLTNLVSNAIKYTNEGVIELSIETKTKVVEIRVKDTGMGISAADQEKLFAPFFRVKNADVSKITGTGLGMWITREFVEKMHGSIGVESIKGVGTQIVVSLPRHEL